MKSILIMTAFCFSVSAAAENQARAELIADSEIVVAGKTVRVGVLLTLPEHAHVYWRNPGDSGLACGVEWDVPQGVVVSDLYWPNPTRFNVEGLNDVNHGYEGKVLLFADVTVPKDASDSLTIQARAYWLLCLDDGVCIPEDTELTLELPVASTTTPSDHTLVFAEFAERVPRAVDHDDVPLALETDSNTGTLTVSTTSPWEILPSHGSDEANYFPDKGPAWPLVEPLGDTSSNQAVFRATTGKDAVFAGVLTVPVRNTQSKETKTLFVAVSE